MAPNNDPNKPSQDFFGEILGAIRCLPSVAPTIYPKVSEATMPKTVITTSQAPSSTCNSVIPKERKNGNHKRSEERRVGKECRSRWGREQQKKKKKSRKNEGPQKRRRAVTRHKSKTAR